MCYAGTANSILLSVCMCPFSRSNKVGGQMWPFCTLSTKHTWEKNCRECILEDPWGYLHFKDLMVPPTKTPVVHMVSVVTPALPASPLPPLPSSGPLLLPWHLLLSFAPFALHRDYEWRLGPIELIENQFGSKLELFFFLLWIHKVG